MAFRGVRVGCSEEEAACAVACLPFALGVCGDV